MNLLWITNSFQTVKCDNKYTPWMRESCVQWKRTQHYLCHLAFIVSFLLECWVTRFPQIYCYFLHNSYVLIPSHHFVFDKQHLWFGWARTDLDGQLYPSSALSSKTLNLQNQTADSQNLCTVHTVHTVHPVYTVHTVHPSHVQPCLLSLSLS